MIPILDNAVLSTDLDCQNYDLKNIGMMSPVPEQLVAIDDPSLTGGRTPLAGSVTNDHVNDLAEIDQDKLNFNGVIPPSWLTDGLVSLVDTPVARGNAAEFLSRKNVPNGYAGLDINGQVTAANFSAGAAVGTVTSIGLSIHDPYRTTGPNPITTSGNLTVVWKNAPPNSWFGSDGRGFPGHPEKIWPFYVTGLIEAPFLGGPPASKFTTGVFPRSRFHAAKPVGPEHAEIGMVPDPGANGARNMYLGRDMNWHHFVVTDPAVAHQPKVPDVTIVLDDWKVHEPEDLDISLVHAFITIRSLLKDSFLFYRITPKGFTPLAFHEAHHDDTPDDVHITLEVSEHDFIEAYASKPGYNNSDVEEWEVITPITDLGFT